MTNDPRCILVYNPISGHGHLDSWNAMFVAFLLKQGWQVLALTPDVPALTSRLTEKGIATSPNLQILAWNAHSGFKDFLRRSWQRWDAFGDQFFYRRPDSEVHPSMSFQQYWTTRFCQWVVPFLFRVSHFLLALYRRRRTFSVSAEGGIDPEQNMTDPKEMALRTNAALKRAKWKPRLALNMYMDTYATRPEKWRQFASINSLPWVGIRFVPSEHAQEAWYALTAFVGMFFLDEDVCRCYRQKFPALQFEYLPDVTEAALPVMPSALVMEIRRRAAGRTIVFLGGSIGGQKNLARWFEVIERADPAKWFFVQLGEIHRGTLTVEDLVALERVQASMPENLLLQEGYLPDERAFNEVIATSDVIFAVYRNFRISSNMPGKAAHFCKPILVSDRYLMGQRVLQYGIGCAVDEDDADAMLAGMEVITARPVPEKNFAHYMADFSIECLTVRVESTFCAVASLSRAPGSSTTYPPTKRDTK
jgi:hypothetical protein